MPYKHYQRGTVYYSKNEETGKVKRFKDPGTRDRVEQFSEALSHGFKPTKRRGLANASHSTRKRVASLGGRSR